MALVTNVGDLVLGCIEADVNTYLPEFIEIYNSYSFLRRSELNIFFKARI